MTPFALGLQRHPTLRCFSKEPQHLHISLLNYKAPSARETKVTRHCWHQYAIKNLSVGTNGLLFVSLTAVGEAWEQEANCAVLLHSRNEAGSLCCNSCAH